LHFEIYRYIEDYESSTLQAIQSSTRPLETTLQRAEFVASSGIAAYRMTYRYVHILQKLKQTLVVNFPIRVQLESESNTNSKLPIGLNNIPVNEFIWNSLSDELGINLDRETSQDEAWPSRVDLSFAMLSLIHIQDTYSKVISPDKVNPIGH